MTIDFNRVYLGSRKAIEIREIEVTTISNNLSNYFQTGKLLQTLDGHKSWVYDIVVDEGRVYSGSFDKTLKVWDIECYEVRFQLENIFLLLK